MSHYESSLQSCTRTYTTASRPTGYDGSVGQFDSHYYLEFVNGISNCVQIYLTICLIIEVVSNITPGHA